MALYQVTIAYDGTDFFGYQRQKNHRTVQGELENALKILGWTGRTLNSSGRTDSGVHAEGQVISFELDWKYSDVKLRSALNSFLPMDIATLDVKLAAADFHPRFSAKARQYRYQIVFMPERHPILDRFYWRVWPKPDENLLKEGAEKLIGKHDFSSLGRPPKKGGSTIRTVTSCEWQLVEEDKAYLCIKAESFLYHMVRRTVFLLVQIGQGRSNAIDLEESLIGKKELPAGIAPAHGLFLEKVIY
ncbi:MAG: tRNA pseudouridine(38-40) synthase TruA [Pelolinea sp.]|nr:tRNA pseudouridine(38-40) synthase TruA [Pelolinea sp.]